MGGVKEGGEDDKGAPIESTCKITSDEDGLVSEIGAGGGVFRSIN